MVGGRLTAERFDKLSSEYEEEQKKVKAKIAELQELIDSGEQSKYDLKEFLKNVRKYTDPKELTVELLNDLVDKIIVHDEKPQKENSLTTQNGGTAFAAPPHYINTSLSHLG